MAEVHEITRAAYKGLALHDYCNGHGDFVVVACGARFEGTPTAFHAVECFESEYWAVRSAEEMQDNALGNARCCGDYCNYYEVWHIVDDEPEVERPDYYRVDMGGNGFAHFPEYEQACEFVSYMMHQPLGKRWCTFCEVWACWADGTENWLGDHWRSVFDGRVFHMWNNDALDNLDLI